jgi:hypothetical protein
VDPAYGELFVPVPVGATLPGGSYATELNLVYARDASGTTPPLRMFDDFTGTASPPTSIAYDSTHDELVVSGAQAIAFFARTTTGATFPKRTIRTASPAGITAITRVAVNGATGEVFAASGAAVAVFPRTASGAAAPSRTLSGASAGFEHPFAVAVNEAASELYVGDRQSRTFATHALGATGDATPVRIVSGATGGVLYPAGVAAAAGRVFVASRGAGDGDASVASFANPWSGSPTPATAIAGAAPALGDPHAVAADASSAELFVANDLAIAFSFDATGNVSRTRTLPLPGTGADATAIAVDAARGEVLVGYADRAVRAYLRTATGTTAPLWQLGPTLAWKPAALAFDATHDEVVGLGWNTNGQLELFVHQRGAGNAIPIRHIAGPAAGLGGATGIVVDPVADEYLVSFADGAIRAYPRTGDGDVAPLRTISGPRTLLSQPSGIATCR